jgi:hypothetical protein
MEALWRRREIPPRLDNIQRNQLHTPIGCEALDSDTSLAHRKKQKQKHRGRRLFAAAPTSPRARNRQTPNGARHWEAAPSDCMCPISSHASLCGIENRTLDLARVSGFQSNNLATGSLLWPCFAVAKTTANSLLMIKHRISTCRPSTGRTAWPALRTAVRNTRPACTSSSATSSSLRSSPSPAQKAQPTLQRTRGSWCRLSMMP